MIFKKFAYVQCLNFTDNIKTTLVSLTSLSLSFIVAVLILYKQRNLCAKFGSFCWTEFRKRTCSKYKILIDTTAFNVSDFCYHLSICQIQRENIDNFIKPSVHKKSFFTYQQRCSCYERHDAVWSPCYIQLLGCKKYCVTGENIRKWLKRYVVVEITVIESENLAILSYDLSFVAVFTEKFSKAKLVPSIIANTCVSHDSD